MANRSISPSVLKAPALSPIRLTSSYYDEAFRAAPLDRRRWSHLPFRLRSNRTSRGPLHVRRRPPALPLRAGRGPPGAPAPHIRVRLVHGLGGPRRRAPPAPARRPPRLASPDLPPGAPAGRPLEAVGDRCLRRRRPPAGLDRRRPRRHLPRLGGGAPWPHAAR